MCGAGFLMPGNHGPAKGELATIRVWMSGRSNSGRERYQLFPTTGWVDTVPSRDTAQRITDMMSRSQRS